MKVEKTVTHGKHRQKILQIHRKEIQVTQRFKKKWSASLLKRLQLGKYHFSSSKWAIILKSGKLFSQKTVGKQAYLNCWFEDKNATPPVKGHLMLSTIMSCTLTILCSSPTALRFYPKDMPAKKYKMPPLYRLFNIACNRKKL